jgi:hypothetical protein
MFYVCLCLYTYIWIMNFIHKDYVICRKINGTEDPNVKQNKPESERQIVHIFSCAESKF